MLRKQATLAVVAIMGSAVALQACGVQSFTLSISNDTPSAVVLRQCSASPWDKIVLRRSTCGVLEDRIQLDPAQYIRVGTAVGATNWYRIEDSSGHLAGCLALRFDHREPSAVINVSRTEKCP